MPLDPLKVNRFSPHFLDRRTKAAFFDNRAFADYVRIPESGRCRSLENELTFTHPSAAWEHGKEPGAWVYSTPHPVGLSHGVSELRTK